MRVKIATREVGRDEDGQFPRALVYVAHSTIPEEMSNYCYTIVRVSVAWNELLFGS